MDGFIRIYDGTRYLVLFVLENYEAIHNRIRYLISLKSSTTHVLAHYYAKIKVDSYDSFWNSVSVSSKIITNFFLIV